MEKDTSRKNSKRVTSEDSLIYPLRYIVDRIPERKSTIAKKVGISPDSLMWNLMNDTVKLRRIIGIAAALDIKLSFTLEKKSDSQDIAEFSKGKIRGCFPQFPKEKIYPDWFLKGIETTKLIRPFFEAFVNGGIDINVIQNNNNTYGNEITRKNKDVIENIFKSDDMRLDMLGLFAEKLNCDIIWNIEPLNPSGDTDSL